MSKQVPKEISKIIRDIDEKKIVLPSIQRKFVWGEDRIIKLFDSIMKGYPFGNILLWKINSKEAIKSYRFYEFIKNFSWKDDTLNQPANPKGKEEINVVMDGQQRLTSLYIGLMGSIESKPKYKSSKKAENYVERFLCFKPYIPDEERDDNDTKYKFEFKTKEELDSYNSGKNDREKYYLVSDFYFETKDDLKSKFSITRMPKDKDDWRNHCEILRYQINDSKILNCDYIANENIKDVLEIFVRINSGGKQLSKSNLLFSTLITTWEEGRDEFDKLIKTINSDKIIYVNEEVLILAAVYLVNGDTSLKLGDLDTKIITDIKDNWNEIKKAIIDTKEFLRKHNFTYEVVKSVNSILPIAYYYYYKKTMSALVEREFVKYFIISQLYGLFGGSSATTLRLIREKLCKKGALGTIEPDFTIKNLFGINLSAGRINAFQVDRARIEKLVDSTKYGMSNAFLVMCLLYPDVRVNLGDFDLDHVYSKDEFKTLIRGVNKTVKNDLMFKRDGIPNLELLDSQANRKDKRAMPLHQWMSNGNKVKFDPFEGKQNPANYDFKNVAEFETFYKQRRDLIVDFLYKEISQ